MQNNFYGSEIADKITHKNPEFQKIKNPNDLYKFLCNIWCEYSCAPRMRDKWNDDDKTLGQCSITAFLAQDIFGGKVLGIPMDDGSVHCYNQVGNYKFDLTSEQFHGEFLDYKDNPEQLREIHFSKNEKRLRYEYLKSELKKLIKLNIF